MSVPTRKTVEIHEAKEHLSRLIDEAVRGEAFVIAKAGRPVLKQRLGFLRGAVNISADFDETCCLTATSDEVLRDPPLLWAAAEAKALPQLAILKV